MSDVEPTVEPTIAGEPATETPADTDEPTGEDMAREVLETLQGANINTPEDVIGMVEAGQQAGHMGNLLGAERDKVANLERMVEQLQQQQQTAPRQEPTDTYYNEPSAVSPQQIESAVTKAVENLQMKQNRAQMEVNARYLADENAIASDQAPAALKGAWDKVKETPGVRQRLMSGQSTLWNEYNNTKLTWYKGLAEKSQTAMEKMLSSGSNTTAPPHVETGDSPSIPRVNDTDDRATQRRQITDPSKGFTGSMDEIEALVNTFIPGDGP